MVITPPTPAELNGPSFLPCRKSPIPTTSIWLMNPMPVMPYTLCSRPPSPAPSPAQSASQASSATWTLTCSYDGQVADTVGSKAASGPRCSSSSRRSGWSSFRAVSTARLSRRRASRPISASSARFACPDPDTQAAYDAAQAIFPRTPGRAYGILGRRWGSGCSSHASFGSSGCSSHVPRGSSGCSSHGGRQGRRLRRGPRGHNWFSRSFRSLIVPPVERRVRLGAHYHHCHPNGPGSCPPA
jgi:hypothetical protein